MKERKRDGRVTIREMFEVFRGSALSSDEKVLWGLYRSYDTGAGAWPGDDVLTAHMGKSVRTVKTYRSKLIELGYLERTLRGPKLAAFHATVPPKGVQEFAPLRPKGCRKGCEILHFPPVPPIWKNTGVRRRAPAYLLKSRLAKLPPPR